MAKGTGRRLGWLGCSCGYGGDGGWWWLCWSDIHSVVDYSDKTGLAIIMIVVHIQLDDDDGENRNNKRNVSVSVMIMMMI